MTESNPIAIGAAPLRIEDVVALARRERTAALSGDAAFRAPNRRGRI